MQKCSGALLLVDALKMLEGGQEQEFFTMKLTSYLGELGSRGRNVWGRRPIGIVFTKADQCEECMEDPEGFAKAHAAGLWEQCQQRFPLHRFFASGVAGYCAWRDTYDDGRVQVPLRIEPCGIIEPFDWLLDKVRKGCR